MKSNPGERKVLLISTQKYVCFYWPSILCEVQAQIVATLHVRRLLFPFPIDFKFSTLDVSQPSVEPAWLILWGCDFIDKISYLDKSHKSVHQWHNRLSWNTTYLGTQKLWIRASLSAYEMFFLRKASRWRDGADRIVDQGWICAIKNWSENPLIVAVQTLSKRFV